ncbi:hypothetical protein G647_00250 [Cladophialophora carrionii CBS 160.54]|uniref:Uncharacterized protein n=1 Tax=Cladophialophora carrionii CBS 160.54 TaxID=1279043 RepID=V9DMB4_9EURO|nr:uncharacterized protein G647_00250 [Cladophialophora carrionii CBS 160.54]ETI27801.1 hypothetical protein G647_00250 [Cladophialophora carrionii CBS 160.54]
MEAIPHLLAVIRNLADRSEFVKQLVGRPEALEVSMTKTDIQQSTSKQPTVFYAVAAETCSTKPILRHSKGLEYRLVGKDAAEYDFRDFRWAKLERLRRGARSSTNIARDEALLEYSVDTETAPPSAAASPRLDAMDVRNALPRLPATQTLQSSAPSDALNLPEIQGIQGPGMAPSPQPWWGLAEPENVDQVFSLDWSWFLDESGQTWDF